MCQAEAAKWNVGDFAIMRGSPVRIESETAPGRFSVEYVSNYEHGAGICCGGYSSSWGAEELAPITDAEAVVLCNAYAAKRAIEAAKREIVQQERLFEANVAALTALKVAREAAAASR